MNFGEYSLVHNSWLFLLLSTGTNLSGFKCTCLKYTLFTLDSSSILSVIISLKVLEKVVYVHFLHLLLIYLFIFQCVEVCQSTAVTEFDGVMVTIDLLILKSNGIF